MSAKKELEKLQAMRAELEEESHSLKEKQRELESNLRALEEKVAIEELKREKAIIEELKNRNKATRDVIAQLEAKKKELEGKLEQQLQQPETPPAEKETAAEEPPEEAEEGGVTVTAMESEALVESPEAMNESPKKPEKKKHRFF